MYHIHSFEPKIYLFDKNGDYWVFNTILSAANCLCSLFKYTLHDKIGEQFRILVSFYFTDHNFINYNEYPYILRTELGDIITVDDLKLVYNANKKVNKKSWWWRSLYSYNHKKMFRNGPVPGICGSGRGGGYYRHPKSILEKRITDGHLHDNDIRNYKIKIRGKRRPANLPCSWYDRRRSDVGHRSWKTQRRTQWKKK